MLTWSFFTILDIRTFWCINPFTNKPWFLRVCGANLLKTLGKAEIARNEQFLLFPLCFPPVWRTSCHFHQFEIMVCKLFQFGPVQICHLGKG